MPNYVNACITNVSFPTNIEGLYEMIDENDQYQADIEYILDYEMGDELEWSTPKWLTKGDILFFYHAVTAKQRIKSLLYKTKKLNDSKLSAFLNKCDQTADLYAGKIFAFGLIDGKAEYSYYVEDDRHFKGRIFAPVSKIHILKFAISKDQFSEYLKISRQSTFTYLTKVHFDFLKKILSQHSQLPDYFKESEFSELSLKSINSKNWLEVSTLEQSKFALEIQLRTYFIDHLLNYIKDNRTPLLEECRCIKDGKIIGVADYFIRISGVWIPVEAKLNINAERDIKFQLMKYLEYEHFAPTKGQNITKKYKFNNYSKLVIVIDQFGIYFFQNANFIKSNVSNPYISRIGLNKDDLVLLIKTINRLLHFD